MFRNFAMNHLAACQTLDSILSNSELKRIFRRCILEKELRKPPKLRRFILQLEDLLKTCADTDDDADRTIWPYITCFGNGFFRGIIPTCSPIAIYDIINFDGGKEGRCSRCSSSDLPDSRRKRVRITSPVAPHSYCSACMLTSRNNKGVT